jgi:hypothetical protein
VSLAASHYALPLVGQTLTMLGYDKLNLIGSQGVVDALHRVSE